MAKMNGLHSDTEKLKYLSVSLEGADSDVLTQTFGLRYNIDLASILMPAIAPFLNS